MSDKIKLLKREQNGQSPAEELPAQRESEQPKASGSKSKSEVAIVSQSKEKPTASIASGSQPKNKPVPTGQQVKILHRNPKAAKTDGPPSENFASSSKSSCRKNKFKNNQATAGPEKQNKVEGLTQNNVKILKRDPAAGRTNEGALEASVKNLSINGSAHNNSRQFVQRKDNNSAETTSQIEHSSVAVYFEITGNEASFLLFKDDRFVANYYVCRAKLPAYPTLYVSRWYTISYTLPKEDSIHMKLLSIERINGDPPIPTRTSSKKANFLITAEYNQSKGIYSSTYGNLQFESGQMSVIQPFATITAWCHPLGGTKEESLRLLKVVEVEGTLKPVFKAAANPKVRPEAIAPSLSIAPRIRPNTAAQKAVQRGPPRFTPPPFYSRPGHNLTSPSPSTSSKQSSPSKASQNEEPGFQRPPHYCHDIVIYESDENKYGGTMVNFAIFKPKKRRFTGFLRVEKPKIPVTVSTELKLGNWYHLRYGFGKNGQLEVGQITRSIRRYPTKVFLGKVKICVIATKNIFKKKKRMAKSEEAPDTPENSEKNNKAEDSESSLEPKLFNEVEAPPESAPESSLTEEEPLAHQTSDEAPKQDPAEKSDDKFAEEDYCRYKCALGMLEPVPRDLLLAKLVDDAERENDEATDDGGAEILDGAVLAAKWPDKMLIWCGLTPLDRYLYLALEPYKIDDILSEEDGDSCSEEFEAFFNSFPEEVGPRVPALSDSFVSQLDIVITALYQRVKITNEKHAEIDKFVATLRNRLQDSLGLSDLAIKPFGSVINGFGWMDCDLDLCLQMEKAVADQKQLIGRIGQCLWQSREHGFLRVNSILEARIPIVKFSHTSGFHGDISIDNLLPHHNSALLATYARFDPRVAPLGIFIKQWAKQLGINNNAAGSLSSYAYIVMLIHFLQICHPPVLPFLQEMPGKSAEILVKGYDVNFIKDTTELRAQFDRQPNTQTLSALFCEFLLYYTRTFDPSHEIIQIRQRSPLTKEQRGVNSGSRRLWIEDPFNLDHNLTAGVKARGLSLLLNNMRRTLMELYSLDKTTNEGNCELSSLDELTAAVKRRRRINSSSK